MVSSSVELKAHSPKFEIITLIKSLDIPPNILLTTLVKESNTSFGNFESAVKSLHNFASCSVVVHDV